MSATQSDFHPLLSTILLFTCENILTHFPSPSSSCAVDLNFPYMQNALSSLITGHLIWMNQNIRDSLYRVTRVRPESFEYQIKPQTLAHKQSFRPINLTCCSNDNRIVIGVYILAACSQYTRGIFACCAIPTEKKIQYFSSIFALFFRSTECSARSFGCFLV